MVHLHNAIKKQKLMISFMMIIALFLCFGIITVNGMFTLGDLTRTIYEHPLVVSNASLDAALNITKMHRSMKDVVLANSYDEMEASVKAADEGVWLAQEIKKMEDDIKRKMEEL